MIRDYQLYIGGADRAGAGHVHCLSAAALLDDVLGAVRAKRELDRGTRQLQDGDPVFARCATSDKGLVDEALQAAADAKMAWASVPLDVRLELMPAFHHALRARAEDFVDVLINEGHPRRFAEIEAASILESTRPELVGWYRRQLYEEHETPTRRLLLVRKPDGVVCMSPPQNAAAGNSMLALGVLAAGNTLVMRAPHSVPAGVFFLHRELTAPILERLGAPPGTLNIITGYTAAILRHWLESPLVNDIFYFGDSHRGLALGKECIEQGKKAILELAGNDGMLIWRDANVPRAARALTECFYASGQACLLPKFAIVHPAVAEELLSTALHLMRSIKPGLPTEDDVILSPVMKSERFFDFLAEANAAGVKVLSGGFRCELEGEPSDTGVFIAPTLLRVDGLAAAETLRAVREETFFPMLPVIVAESADDGLLLERAIAFLNSNHYGLRNSLWAEDPMVVERFCTAVMTGGLIKVNDSHIGTVPPLPAHGGTGRTGGPYGEANYPTISTTHLQAISIGHDVDPEEAVFGSGIRAEPVLVR